MALDSGAVEPSIRFRARTIVRRSAIVNARRDCGNFVFFMFNHWMKIAHFKNLSSTREIKLCESLEILFSRLIIGPGSGFFSRKQAQMDLLIVRLYTGSPLPLMQVDPSKSGRFL